MCALEVRTADRSRIAGMSEIDEGWRMKPLELGVVWLLIAGMFASALLIGPAGPARASAPRAVEPARATPAAGRDRVIAAPAAESDQALPSSGSGSGGPPRALRVCPPGDARADCHRSLQEALAAALPGDHVVLSPGIYEEGAIVATPGLVVRGEPGAHLRGRAVEGKAALVIKADGVVVEGIECSGIAVRDGNGACIRIEGDDLTVRNVNFHDNQQGILSGPGGGALLVEDSRFERNGFRGLAHGVYIGPSVETFTFRNNRVLATTGEGHGVKSRAQRTVVENNVIAGLDGRDSRAIDVPNGGEVLIRGNVLQKGPNSANAQMIGLALEGQLHETNATLIENNLIVFDTRPEGLIQDLARTVGLLPARGIVIASESPGAVVLQDNTIVGAREIGGGHLEDRDNRTYQSRRAAGLPPYPAIPQAVP
jgi:Right handed beta helix region